MLKNVVFYPILALSKDGFHVDGGIRILLDIRGRKIVGAALEKKGGNPPPTSYIYGKLLYVSEAYFTHDFYVILRNNLLHPIDRKKDRKLIEFLVSSPELTNDVETLTYLRKIVNL